MNRQTAEIDSQIHRQIVDRQMINNAKTISKKFRTLFNSQEERKNKKAEGKLRKLVVVGQKEKCKLEKYRLKKWKAIIQAFGGVGNGADYSYQTSTEAVRVSCDQLGAESLNAQSDR